MKNFIRLFILFFIVFDFTGCLDGNDSDPYYFFYDEPAIVESLSDNSVVRTAYGKFCVPSLKNDDDLQTNDILWSSFVVEKKDENKVQMPDNQSYYKVDGFKYDKIDSTKVIIPSNPAEFASCLADNYTEKIDRAVLYKTYVDNLLFFAFEHSSSAGLEGELFLNPQIESANGHPTLYIRAKQKQYPSNVRDKTIFAFDMSDFLIYYRKTFPGKNPVQFNLKYYVETKNGEDIYREFLSNPLSWQLK